MKCKKRFACAVVLATACVFLVGCSGNPPGKSSETAPIIEPGTEKYIGLDESSPLKIGGLNYDVTRNEISLDVRNASSKHSINGIRMNIKATVSVNGVKEVVNMGSTEMPGYIGFYSDNASGGFIAWKAFDLEGLKLEPGKSKTVHMPFAGVLTKTSVKGTGPIYLSGNAHSDSAYIDGFVVTSIDILDYQGDVHRYKYNIPSDLKAEYEVSDTSVVSDERGHGEIVSDAKVSISNVAYEGDTLTFTADVSAKDFESGTMMLRYTNGLGTDEMKAVKVKAGKNNVAIEDAGRYNLPPELECICIRKG